MQRVRFRRLKDEQRQAEAEQAAAAEDDAASDALSLPEGAELIDDWVSSEPSTGARERDAAIKKKWKEASEKWKEPWEARRRIHNSAKEISKCPYL